MIRIPRSPYLSARFRRLVSASSSCSSKLLGSSTCTVTASAVAVVFFKWPSPWISGSLGRGESRAGPPSAVVGADLEGAGGDRTLGFQSSRPSDGLRYLSKVPARLEGCPQRLRPTTRFRRQASLFTQVFEPESAMPSTICRCASTKTKSMGVAAIATPAMSAPQSDVSAPLNWFTTSGRVKLLVEFKKING